MKKKTAIISIIISLVCIVFVVLMCVLLVKNKKSKDTSKEIQNAGEATYNQPSVAEAEEKYKDAAGIYTSVFKDELEGATVVTTYWIELKDDGNGTLSIQDSIPIEWDAKGNIKTKDNVKMQFSISEDELTLNQDDYSEMVFTKSAGKIIRPQNISIDAESVPDGIYAADIYGADIKEENDKLIIPVSLYSVDKYSEEDMDGLEEGDSIIVDGNMYVVDRIESEGDVITINGGLNEGGVELIRDIDTGDYTYFGWDDIKSYTYLLKKDFEADDEMVFSDFQDLSNPMVLDRYSLLDFIADDYLYELNTTVEISGGKIVNITREYMP